MVGFLLLAELAVFLVLALSGTLPRFGPALVASIMAANLLILIGVAALLLLRRRR
jgi:hypothetical protein